MSVIVCCYNSSLRLPETLRHLALQEVPAGIPWEIIVIDNASTDATAQVAKQEWEKFGRAASALIILEEPRPGKNHAFRTGIAAAKYAYILTCDDDNWLFPDYVARAHQIMKADPKIGALGGQGIFEPQLPLNQEIGGYTSYYVNGPQTSADSGHWVYGAGSVYRKKIFTDLIKNGWQQLASGRKGSSLICGEDVEICFMIYLSGYKITADNDLLFKHFVPLQRQTMAYINKLSFGHGYTNVLLNSYYAILNNDPRPFNQTINGWLPAATKTLVKSSVLLIYQTIKQWKKPAADQLISFNSQLGTWFALFRERKEVISHHLHTKALLMRKVPIEKR